MYDKTYVTPVGNKGLYMLNTASWRTERPVMEKSLCINCGICMGYCPVNSVQWSEEQGYQISYDYCKGCGICAVECPKKAISMVKEGTEE